MGSKKSKQPLARFDVSGRSLHGSTRDSTHHTDRSESDSATEAGSTSTATEITTEDAARNTLQIEAGRVDTEAAQLTAKRFTPPNCSLCTELRPDPNKSYVTVYHTRREGGFVIRYCKCGFCGNTFKAPEEKNASVP